MKKSKIICIFILVIATANALFWGDKKQGMFLDEIYSLMMANSKNLSNLFSDSVINTTLPKSVILEQIEVQNGERFDFKSVYRNIKLDRHPPLYYCLIHFFSSLFPNSHSKWIGIGLNLIVFWLLICLYFQLINKLFGSVFISSCTTLLFAISRIGVSNVIQIRMYVLLSLFAVLFVFQIWKLFREDRSWRTYTAIAVSIWLGIMTQYIFVILTFFVCISFSVYLFKKNEVKTSFFLLMSWFSGVLLSLITFPNIVLDLFTFNPDVSGASAIARLLDIGAWGERLFLYTGWIGASMFWVCLFGLVLLVLAVVNRKRIIDTTNDARVFLLIMLGSSFLTYFIVCVISPWVAPRYIYYLVPIFLMLLSYLLQVIMSFISNRDNKYLIISAIICGLLTISHSFYYKPEWLYEDDEINNATLAGYRKENAKCLCFFENSYAPISSALQLLEFDDFFIAGNSLSNSAVEYIGSSSGNHLIVFIEKMNTDKIENHLDSDAIINEIIEKTSFRTSTRLFDFGFNDAFLISK